MSRIEEQQEKELKDKVAEAKQKLGSLTDGLLMKQGISNQNSRENIRSSFRYSLEAIESELKLPDSERKSFIELTSELATVRDRINSYLPEKPNYEKQNYQKELKDIQMTYDNLLATIQPSNIALNAKRKLLTDIGEMNKIIANFNPNARNAESKLEEMRVTASTILDEASKAPRVEGERHKRSPQFPACESAASKDKPVQPLKTREFTASPALRDLASAHKALLAEKSEKKVQEKPKMKAH